MTARPEVATFLRTLATVGFSGRMRPGRAARVVNATDNSIYYREPACVVEPCNIGDIRAAVAAAACAGLSITPRGGGTGTNGQSLTGGVVLDTSRFMNRILGFDAATGIVRVQPGVVLDQLNAYLKPLGYFFPPAVSTASRATLGGMVATDASGKGSRKLGRTSDYLVSAEVVLADGSIAEVGDLIAEEDAPAGPLGEAVSLLRRELPKHAEDISQVFPVMNRGLTGYNLDEVRGTDGTLRLAKLLAGSEGTLAIAAELTLRVMPLPECTGMAIVGYADSLTAMDAVSDLLDADPLAIEFLDDVTVNLGKTTPSWPTLEPVLGTALSACGGFLFVEVSGPSADDIDRQLADVERAAMRGQAQGVVATRDPQTMNALNGLRKDAVGLMGKGKGRLKGTGFVEDAAVPPENLVGFVREFRDILDANGLEYGMYGHADVGCVHVRPLMDMTRPEHRAMIRPISDAVTRLAQRQGGLIWGEHGKGVRGEYVEQVFGPALFGLLRQIKAAFDPGNLLNPGKLVTAAQTDLQVDPIDGIPFRGARDQVIAGQVDYAKASDCNGNGLCFHWDTAQEMCPSYKVTRDRVQSPKGRASLFRDWLHARTTGEDASDAQAALAQSLDTCLSCKACTSQCPVQVDIPTMKARFLDETDGGGGRSLRDALIRRMEDLTLTAARIPHVANAALTLGRPLVARLAGLVDLPAFDRKGLHARLAAAGSRRLKPGQDVPADIDRDRAVILLCDSFLGPFEPAVLEATARVLTHMGLRVFHTPILRNGKAAQVRGYLADFAKVQSKAARDLERLASTSIPLISVEPAVTMLYRQDFSALPKGLAPQSVDNFLAARCRNLPRVPAQEFTMIGHCTETSADPNNLKRWEMIFSAAGLTLNTRRAGCCGMAGLFGHEAEHREMSQEIYALNWAEQVAESKGALLATGFSCRSQVKRFAGVRTRHPIEALATVFDGTQAPPPARRG
ncbi:FAD-binding and (Fe-S)-binding domain-containing protein [Shimia biformata]|uniref:FAD-binding and (Fe-S)-binding domain-containing protein n=1 Tax=Shimia biformata TaxID=1294299 RepID=UPI00194FD5F4|nr:FAD-binding and (Fe-S)-binding domain-containing protein [Shimia biformata]